MKQIAFWTLFSLSSIYAGGEPRQEKGILLEWLLDDVQGVSDRVDTASPVSVVVVAGHKLSRSKAILNLAEVANGCAPKVRANAILPTVATLKPGYKQ